MNQWTIWHVRSWLLDHGFLQAVDSFLAEDIDGPALLALKRPALHALDIEVS